MPFLAPAALRALAAAGFTRSRPCRRVRSMLSGWFKASSNYMTAGDTLSRFADRLNGSSQMSVRQTLRAPEGRTCPHLKRIRNTRMSEPRAHPTPRVPELRVHLSLARVRTLRAPYIARARIVHAPESHPHPKPGSPSHVRPNVNLCRAGKAPCDVFCFRPRIGLPSFAPVCAQIL